MTVALREAAAARPHALAVTDGTTELSLGEANDLVNRIANGLLSVLERDDRGGERRVAVMARNSVEVVLTHVAALAAGASPVPTSALLGADECAYIFRDSAASVAFAGPETLTTVLAAAAEAGVPLVVAWRVGDALPAAPDGVRLVRFEDWTAGCSNDEPVEWPEPLLPLLYTSGTTGRPKGTEIRTFPPRAATTGEWLATLGSTLAGAGKPHIVVGPLHHTGPYLAVRHASAGTPVVVMPRFDAEAALELIDRYGCATTLMVPTHFTRLLALPDDARARYDVSTLEWVAHTGAATPVDVKRRMIEWFGPCLYEAYGASESGTVCAIMGDEWLAHPGSVGRPTPGFRVHVLDDAGEPLPAGTEGRLFFEDLSGRGIVYRNDPAKTAGVHVRPGVFTLGEVGYVDADGYVYITDRTSDMVVSGGVNVYPAEAEQVIVTHPSVRDAAGIGVPNSDLGEELRMLVELNDAGRTAPPSHDELIAWCRERLAHYKCPRTVEIVDSVGRTVMGKLNKRELRAPYWPTNRTIG